ncbi:MAG: exo-beta-N-acetylmuramidase NamZ domain-containing protein [Gemmatimonadaceae bacterium]
MILLRGAAMRETSPRETTGMQRGRERAEARCRRRIVHGTLFMLGAAACAARGAGQTGAAKVRPGISVLITDSIHLVRGRRVGLLTNQTGVDEHGESDIERLRGAEARAAGVQLVRLFSPEHGIRGTEDRENLASGIDQRSGLFIHSLYQNGTIAPPDSTLRDLDVLVVDLQDIGTRTWTYVGAMLYSMRAAARRNLPIVVLDRPNPLSGLHPDGPILDSAIANPNEPTPAKAGRAYALYPVPLRHALTMGEMARYFNAELRIGARLHVVPTAGWRRAMWFDEAGLPWVRPSPNLPTLASATVYPALVAFEATNVSVGRGTADAFQRLGAPWLRSDSAVALLNARGLPGVRFERSDFTPQGATDGKYSDRQLEGIRIVVTDRDRFSPGHTGAALLWAIHRVAPDSLVMRASAFDDRFGRPAMREAIMGGDDPDAVVARDSAAVQAWWRAVAQFRLYR